MKSSLSAVALPIDCLSKFYAICMCLCRYLWSSALWNLPHCIEWQSLLCIIDMHAAYHMHSDLIELPCLPSISFISLLCFFFSYLLQSKCSIFRGVILCLCLNLTYANVVRFPRELNRHGVAFLLPYLVILLFIGLPIILLEIALGQFLGQGSAHSWRASPILRGK